ncbi:hypothetical protein M0638_08580 [Roseomonas sp. NAR14]|uniref:Uncharacterized protein n=1 Tax=Roseomonas acroporae TaxID=2937791 RepID=A0A9X1Y783_9PROT|nr:hypothetical protein [Roseomonas acroporae]MCK8784433.1 hypothetical protein [Roseomonas acroporae]
MAFDPHNLTVLAQGNGFTLWHYRTAEPQAAVMAVGYFDTAWNTLQIGDVIVLHTADSVALTPVHALPPPGTSLGGRLVLDDAPTGQAGLATSSHLFALSLAAAAGFAVARPAVLHQAGGRLLLQNGGTLLV